MAADNNEWFRKTEARLYAYPALIAKHRQAIHDNQIAPSLKATKYTATSFCRGGEIVPEAERWVLRRERLAQKILFLEDQLQEEMSRISSLFEVLEEIEQKYLVLKYFENRPGYVIANRLERSHTTCKTIQKKVIFKAAYIFDNISQNEYEKLLIG